MQRPGPPGWGFGVGLTTLPGKRKIVEKPPRNSAGFSGDQGLPWVVEPRKEERIYIYIYIYMCVCVCVCVCIYIYIYMLQRSVSYRVRQWLF
jgi:Tfp pilus assembly protein PilN